MDPAVARELEDRLHRIARWRPTRWIVRNAMLRADPTGAHIRIERVRWEDPGYSQEDSWTGKSRTVGGGHVVADVMSGGWLLSQSYSPAWGLPKPGVQMSLCGPEYGGLVLHETLRTRGGATPPDVSDWPAVPRHEDTAAWAAEMEAIRDRVRVAFDATEMSPGDGAPGDIPKAWPPTPTSDEDRKEFGRIASAALAVRQAWVDAELERVTAILSGVFRADERAASGRDVLV